ncbi:hypothetical protein AVEN_1565-1 [Araneus ventricosus]|uniref:F-box domain-containing protein n=1 Tax=Araneus ventricosus TaxID=182803 RepID=A0A4Y2DSD7_ARAVE|nr:hypothetical protein AVEN_1565-1 [Araneus ventricosus]
MDSLPSEMNPTLNAINAFDIQSSHSMKKCDKQGQWAELPSLPLERIYSFLNRDNQINMSQVCRNWSEGFNSPSVWKTFKFSFTESQLSMDPCPKIKCAEKYSRMFRHVVIDCIKTVNEHLIETWCKRLIVFFDILTRNSQLISLKVRWPEFFFILDTINCEEGLEKVIDRFVNSQQHLKRVEFYSCYFFFPISEFIKDMAKDHKEFPMHFVLRRFVDPIEPMDQGILDAAQSQHVLLCQRSQMFQELPTFQTDYLFIFESMSESQFAAINKLRKSQVSKMIFQCYGPIQSHFRGLTSDSWRFLKQLYTDLQIELYFETDSQSRPEVEFFIVPDMPITQMDYRFTVCKPEHSSIMEIDALFSHLRACKTNDHLVSFNLAWILPIPDLASIFIPFLQDCTKLKCLQLFIIYPANGIDLLARSWLENRPESLEKVVIDISDVGNEDNYRSLMNLVTKYVSLLKVIGLNLDVKLNYGKTIFRESS